MTIIWISNTSPISQSSSEILKNYSGGWLQEQFNFLSKNQINIIPFFPGKTNKYFKNKDYNFVTFKPVSLNVISQKRAEKYFNEIISEIKPNLIHIHGTELPHCYVMSKVALSNNISYLVSLQGIVSEIYKHILTGIDPELIYKKSFRDHFLPSSLISQRRLYKSLSKLEKLVVTNASYIFGRTEWDRSWIDISFDSKKYITCYEPLRKSFYFSKKWEFKNCTKYTIFLSQSSTSIKGLHILLDAITLIKPKYPDVKLYIAGKNYASNSIRNLLLRTSYENYIINYISKNSLTNNVTFIGPQDESGMIRNLLSTHVYVQSSVIENSPNSLMEALHLGVPSISSYVGGIPSLYNKILFYQSDSSLMLAANILKIFSNHVTYNVNYETEKANIEDIGNLLLKTYNKFSL